MKEHRIRKRSWESIWNVCLVEVFDLKALLEFSNADVLFILNLRKYLEKVWGQVYIDVRKVRLTVIGNCLYWFFKDRDKIWFWWTSRWASTIFTTSESEGSDVRQGSICLIVTCYELLKTYLQLWRTNICQTSSSP